MLYLIQPNGWAGQYDMSVGRAIVRRDVEKKSLESLRWETVSEFVDYDQLLHVAQRFGIATPTGLMVDAGFYRAWTEPELMESVQAQREELLQQLNAVSHQQVSGPGYAEHASRIDRDAREAALDAKEKYQNARIARENLEKQVDEDKHQQLMHHWNRVSALMHEFSDY